MVSITECPRDAMQGLKAFVPTEVKVRYIDQLLKVGYDVLDFGSFVSPKAIPQMRDTAKVIEQLDLSDTRSKLLAIIANKRGAIDALQFEQIDFLGFPFSISETFQRRNTNATIEESLDRVFDIQDLCIANQRDLVVYISMGFGNPYGDPWNLDIVLSWVEKLIASGIRYIALSDTVGVANPDNIGYLFKGLTAEHPDIHFGAHLHTQAHNWEEKIKVALDNGCRRFDTAIKGYGGCPMAKDDLTGNMATENLIYFLDKHNVAHSIDHKELHKAMALALEVFPQ